MSSISQPKTRASLIRRFLPCGQWAMSGVCQSTTHSTAHLDTPAHTCSLSGNRRAHAVLLHVSSFTESAAPINKYCCVWQDGGCDSKGAGRVSEARAGRNQTVLKVSVISVSTASGRRIHSQPLTRAVSMLVNIEYGPMPANAFDEVAHTILSRRIFCQTFSPECVQFFCIAENIRRTQHFDLNNN